MLENNIFDKSKYPILHDNTHLLKLNPNPLLGMDDTLKTILAGLYKKEMSNVLLIAEAGGGKTATVQEFAKRYANKYIVLETSIAQMQAGGVEYLAKNFKELFYELDQYRRENKQSRELILFIDEFHQLPMASKAAVEDLKPEFARSSQLGIHIIGATTYDEYRLYIQKNMALLERFQLINLPVADNELTYKILKSRLKKEYHYPEDSESDHILREIIYYTDTYIKDRIQPRKSTDLLDQMMGWVAIGEKFSHELLAKVLYRATNIRIDLQLDAKKLKDFLNKRVFNQTIAVDRIVKNAYSAILGVNDPHKPRGVFLFVGSTGVGKTELAKQFTAGMFGENAHLVTFDMSEYQETSDVETFQYRLTDIMLQSNSPVILLDEIEKANKGVTRLLFSVFDEARLSDRNGRPVNFANVFFLLTTNAGENVFNDISGRGYSNEELKKELMGLDKLIFTNLSNDRSFPTALLGRLTGYIPFAPMSEDTNKLIARRKLNQIAKIFMTKQNIKLRFDNNNLIRYITKEKLDTSAFAGGARQINNIINRDVTDTISEYVIFHPHVYDLYISTAGLARTLNKKQLSSHEYVKVTPTSKEIIESDYKNAKVKYTRGITILFKKLISQGMNLRFDENELFRALARNERGQGIDENIKEFFEPLVNYNETRRAYLANPDSNINKLPNSVKLSVTNGELIVDHA